MPLRAWVAAHQSWMAAAAGLTVVVAAGAAYVVLRARRLPKVVLYPKRDNLRPKVIRLVVENIGGTRAKDLRFTFSEPLPTGAAGSDDTPEAEKTTGAPLSNGITLLGPGTKRVVYWGLYQDLSNALGDRVIQVTINYQSDPEESDKTMQYAVESAIDLKALNSKKGRKRKRGRRGWHKV